MAQNETARSRAVREPEASLEANDEVIDLLEVVKPGKLIAKKSVDDDVDFSADLDSMLDSLSRAEQEKASSEDLAGTQPFPDPTPVAHEVDPDERLDMPGLDDLDDILKSLDAGAQKAASGSAPDKSEAAEAVGEDILSDMPDLDAMPTLRTSSTGSPSRRRAKVDDPLDALLTDVDSPQQRSASLPDSDEEDLFASLQDADPRPGLAPDAGIEFDENDLDGLALDPFAQDKDLSADALDPEDDMGLNELLADIDVPEKPVSPKPVSPKPVSPKPDALSSALEDKVPPASSTNKPGKDDLFASPRQKHVPAANLPLDTDGAEQDAISQESGIPRMSDAGQDKNFLLAAFGDVETQEPGAAAGSDDSLAEFFDDAGKDSPGTSEVSLAAVGNAAPDPLLSIAGAVEQPSGISEGGIISETLDVPAAVAAVSLEDSPRMEDTVQDDHALPEMPVRQAGQAPGQDPACEPSPNSRFDEVDLNELDALLDDMLATAPASGPGPADVLAAQSAAVPPAQAATLDALPAATLDAEMRELSSELSGLRLDLEALNRDFHEELAGIRETVLACKDPSLPPPASADDLSALRSKLAAQDAVISSQAAMLEELKQALADQNVTFGQKNIEIIEQNSYVRELGQQVSELVDRMQSVESQVAELHSNLEKAAAQAAAKIIREEIAALLEAAE